jgi:hypothetical protein
VIHLGGGVYLITRDEWGAKAPTHRTSLTPSFGTTTHWEGPPMGTFPHASCYTKVRGIQAFHMGPQRGWSDIAYTALICPHGFVFQGRWVGIRTAANGTNDGNNQAYAVCHLCGQGDPFTDEAKHAGRVTLDWLDRNGGAGPGRNCHRDWKPTECPGDAICAWVKAGQPDPAIPPPSPEPPPVPTLRGLDVSAFFFNAEGRPTRIYDGGFVMGLPGGSPAIRFELVKLFDDASKHAIGKPLSRHTLSVATYEYLSLVSTTHGDDAPGAFFTDTETGERFYVVDDYSGKIGPGATQDAIMFIMASQGYDVKPKPLGHDQLAGIPDLDETEPAPSP